MSSEMACGRVKDASKLQRVGIVLGRTIGAVADAYHSYPSEGLHMHPVHSSRVQAESLTVWACSGVSVNISPLCLRLSILLTLAFWTLLCHQSVQLMPQNPMAESRNIRRRRRERAKLAFRSPLLHKATNQQGSGVFARPLVCAEKALRLFVSAPPRAIIVKERESRVPRRKRRDTGHDMFT